MKRLYKPSVVFPLSLILSFMIVIPIYLSFFQISFFSKTYTIILVFCVCLLSFLLAHYLSWLYNRIEQKELALLLTITFIVSLLLNLINPNISNIEPIPYFFLEDHTLEITFASDEQALIEFEGIKNGKEWVSYNALRFEGNWSIHEDECSGITDGEVLKIVWQGRPIGPLVFNYRGITGDGILEISWDDHFDRRNLIGDGNPTYYEIPFSQSHASTIITTLLKIFFSFSINFLLVSVILIFLLTAKKSVESHGIQGIQFISDRYLKMFGGLVLILSISLFSINNSYNWGKRYSPFSDWQQFYIGPMQEAIEQLDGEKKVLLEEPRFSYYLRENAPVVLMFSGPTLNMLQSENIDSIIQAVKNNDVGIVILQESSIPKIWDKTKFYQFLEDDSYAQLIYKSPPSVSYMPFRIYRIQIPDYE